MKKSIHPKSVQDGLTSTSDLFTTCVKLSTFLAELQNRIVEHTLYLFSDYNRTMSDAYPTFTFWDMVIDATNLFIQSEQCVKEIASSISTVCLPRLSIIKQKTLGKSLIRDTVLKCIMQLLRNKEQRQQISEMERVAQ